MPGLRFRRHRTRLTGRLVHLCAAGASFTTKHTTNTKAWVAQAGAGAGAVADGLAPLVSLVVHVGQALPRRLGSNDTGAREWPSLLTGEAKVRCMFCG